MHTTAHYIPYRATHRFVPIVTDYLDGVAALTSFYAFRPDDAGIKAAIAARAGQPTDRETLARMLEKQYHYLPHSGKVEANIALLRSEKTFTVCTAHQPNLATGYLYFVYKILHAIRLAAALKEQHPDFDFVPVYYMGSEDADLDELGTFRYGSKKWVWQTDQTGAVGRMRTEGLKPLLDELLPELGPPGAHRDELTLMLQNAYLGQETIARATHALVHALFGAYGLLVLDADEADLKRIFIPVMEEELFEGASEQLVKGSIEVLEAAGYEGQAHPRAINLFYLKDGLRARIERTGKDRWEVAGSNSIAWNAVSLREELHAHPECFSPNVILRPLYQETILPNVAFIGGGAEVAYWLQLSSLFAHHKVFFPVVILRQSVAWMDEAASRLHHVIGLPLGTLFLTPHEAARAYVALHTDTPLQTSEEQAGLKVLMVALTRRVAGIDPTLERSAGAALQRMMKQLQTLETKMVRAAKRRQATALSRLSRLQEALFPEGGLGERVENFMPYFLRHGAAFFETLLRIIDPLRGEFLVVTEDVMEESQIELTTSSP